MSSFKRPTSRKARPGKGASSIASSTSSPSSSSSTDAEKLAQLHAQLPPGTVPSLQHGRSLLVSSGLGDLDDVIGGGIPIGSIFLLEQDRLSEYYLTFLRYFLADSVDWQHDTVLYSADLPCEVILEGMPSIRHTEEQETTTSAPTPQMKIAWRYEQQLKNATHSSSSSAAAGKRLCRPYDLSKPRGQLKECQPLSQVDLSSLTDKVFPTIFDQLVSRCESMRQKSGSRSVLRVVIHAFCSPLWRIRLDRYGQQAALCFLHRLRAFLRTQPIVCYITFPGHLYEASFTRKVHHLSDTVVSLTSFAGSGEAVNPAFRDFTGMLSLEKLPLLNCLLASMPNNPSFLFTRRRRSMTIIPVYLPPESSRSTKETAERDEQPTTIQSTLTAQQLCGGGTAAGSAPSELDF